MLLAAAGAAAGVAVSAAALEVFRPRRHDATASPRRALDGTALSSRSSSRSPRRSQSGWCRPSESPAWTRKRLCAKAAEATDSPGRHRVTRALVTVEVALSVGLLTVAGLLLTSFVRIDAVERGFEPRNVLTGEVGLPRVRYPDDNRDRVLRGAATGLDAQPGVVAAGVTSSLPLSGNNWGSTVNPEGVRLSPEERLSVDYRFVSPGYLDAMRIPLLAGRSIEDRDDGRFVAVLSESAARRYWPEGDVVGQRFFRGDPSPQGDLFEIIGVVPDVHSAARSTEPRPLVYAPLRGREGSGGTFPMVSIAVRTEGDPALAGELVRRTVASLDSELAVSRIRTMSEIEKASLRQRRFQLILAVAFGAASLLIAALGTYSVVAYDVARRAHDISLRMALGGMRAVSPPQC